MGLLLTKAVEKLSTAFGSTKQTKILMLGLDGAGKTTIIYKLKLNEYLSTVPTIGFNVESIDYKNLRMTIWDIGGQKAIRDLWKHYYAHTDAIIFIVDSCDEERLDVAKEELMHMLDDEELRDIPVLVYANKQDIGTVTPARMVTKFEMHKLKRPWQVQGACAPSGEGLYEGLEWLNQEIKKSKK